MKRITACFVAFILLFFVLGVVCYADDDAVDLTNFVTLESSQGDSLSKLLDANYNTYLQLQAGTSVSIECQEEIAFLYIVFDRVPQEWFLTDAAGKETICGEYGFLHELVDVTERLGRAKNKLVLSFEETVSVADVYVFSEGCLPSFVQVWEEAKSECDLLLFATHSDDDQLFFAGLLPSFTARGLVTQVVYFANHWDTHNRPHEVLNGLWHTGVKRYPVISQFPDAYSESVAGAEYNLQSVGFDRSMVLHWQTEQLRYFRPLVVVGHDIDGEYGHGQHMYNTETLIEAVSLSKDGTYQTPTNKVWDVPRLYLHLYDENVVYCNYDVPLEEFGGKTAFEVSKEAFGFHKSQHWTWFADWIDVEKAAGIRTNSPCKFGLYYSASGNYTVGDDLFFGVKSYAELAEEERLAQEEAARLEEEQKRKDELEKAEQNLSNLEESLDNAEKQLEQTGIWVIILLLLFVFLIFLFVFLSQKLKALANHKSVDQ